MLEFLKPFLGTSDDQKKGGGLRFGDFQMQSKMSLEKKLEKSGLTSSEKQRFFQALKGKIGDGQSVSNAKILKAVNEQYGYDFMQKAKKVLSDVQAPTGLTTEQKRRNVAVGNLERQRDLMRPKNIIGLVGGNKPKDEYNNIGSQRIKEARTSILDAKVNGLSGSSNRGTGQAVKRPF